MVAKNVTSEDVKNSISLLLSDKALVWYRSIKNEVKDWPDLVKRLKNEFLPPDYSIELMREIRSRIQGNNEEVGMFFACMKGLFSRLPKPLSEAEKLSILRRNISPYYIHHLGLVKISSVEELLSSCKTLETSRELANRPRSHQQHTVSSLEPDLAIGSEERRNHAFQNSKPRVFSVNDNVHPIKCWNCRLPGHKYPSCRSPRRKFCFSCGRSNVVKTTCPNCTKNAQ